MKRLLPILLLATACHASLPSWVDPNQMIGTNFGTLELYVGYGVASNGTVSDPEGTALLTAFRGEPSVIWNLDPNTGAWNWDWRPTAPGVFYFQVETAYDPAGFIPGGELLYDTGTWALRVWPPDNPPQIKVIENRVYKVKEQP